MLKIIRIVIAVILILLFALGGFLYARYGGGQPYPDISTAPRFSADQLETVLEYPEPLGNLAVAADGRVFFTVHPESRPTGAKLLVYANKQFRPFPNAEAQTRYFDAVMGVRMDRQGRLWTLDHGQHGSGQARLMAFDSQSGAVVFDYGFPKTIAPVGSFLQDFNVDSTGNMVYIADVSFVRQQPGIVIVNTATRQSWRALTGHASVMPQNWIIRNPIKDMVFLGGLLALKPGVDGITLSQDGSQLYFAAMAHDTLYRVPVTALASPEAALQAADALVAVGKKPLNDGLASDSAGNVLITDVEHGGVAQLSPDGTLRTVIRDDQKIRWADALSFGPDGYLYIADSSIPDQMLQSKAHMQRAAPYAVYRFKPDASGRVGQ